MKVSEIVLSHGEENDATAFPVWAICLKAGFGHIVWLSGPWFNRRDAEDFLKARNYRFPVKAFVYCFSGEESWHWKELYAIARKEAAEAALDVAEVPA
jgi:hypothetical protein